LIAADLKGNMTISGLSIVVIGRNEGSRLVRCLKSIQGIHDFGAKIEIIYADSGSTDGSPEAAESFGAKVIVLNTDRPTAALGRETGWRMASFDFVLFLDGDTILDPDFPARALSIITADPTLAAVWGHLREINPKASIYNRVLDLDWIYPVGETDLCGGNVLMRRQALELAGGYDVTLIAGEEPDLCCRIKAHGYRILNIDAPMVGHDLAMTRFRQYWKRSIRTGYAYAEVSRRYRNTENPLWSSARASNLKRGMFWMVSPIVAVGLSILAHSILPFVLWCVIFAGLSLRSSWSARWKSRDALALFVYGMHSHFQQIPICIGQLQYGFSQRQGKRKQLIEYKENV
jgi:glycosyltransferase involved in cell wall biosynthesis